MSDTGDKRFEPTASRRRRAKREGNVPRSPELSSLAAFAAATGAAAFAVPAAAIAAAAALRAGIGGAAGPIAWLACAALAPAAAAAVAGTAASIAMCGSLVVAPVRIDPKRLDPIAGLRRIAGRDTLVAVVRAACAFAAALAAMVPLAGDLVASAGTLRSPHAAAALAGAAGLRACAGALAAGGAFAIVDVVLARRRWLRGLRMSVDEMKRDAKENDGDPHARARRKSAHRAVVRGGIGRTAEASFVVVNPTHVAVALRYAPPAVAVPEILVRAADEVALRVRAVAAARNIPVIEDVALARLLYAQGAAGSAIPLEAYVAVAQIIADLAREAGA